MKTCTQYFTESPSQLEKDRKEKESILHWQRRNKLLLFADNYIIHGKFQKELHINY